MQIEQINEQRETLKKAELMLDACKWKKIIKDGKSQYYNPISMVVTEAANPGYLRLEASLNAAKMAIENSEKQFLMQFKEKRQAFKDEQKDSDFAKKAFENHLMDEQKYNSESKFSECEKKFKNFDFYKQIAKEERSKIFTKCMKRLEEIEDNGIERKERNIRTFRRVLKVMDITYQTTWKEAQELIEASPRIQRDKKLLKMDKEDMLIVFSELILELEEQEEAFKLQFAEKVVRRQRKNRERFENLMKVLHENGYIDASTLWKEIVPFFSARVEFISMIGQPGSTPLDLFKFYVQSLKNVTLKVKMEADDEAAKPKSAYKRKKPKMICSWNRVALIAPLNPIKEENVLVNNSTVSFLNGLEYSNTNTNIFQKIDKKPKEKKISQFKEAQNIFECPDCFYKAKRRDHIKRHYMTIHLKERRFRCEECKKGNYLFSHNIFCCIILLLLFSFTDFSMKAHLQRHQANLHSNQNLWVCDCCGKRYSSKRVLFHHLKTHMFTDYKCSICDKNFQRLTNLKNHMKLHEGVCCEKCEHCNEKFATKNQLKQHVVANHFTDKMQCKFCASQFIRKHHYKRHLVTVHKKMGKKVMADTLKNIEKISTDYKQLKFIVV